MSNLSVALDGEHLTIENLVRIARDPAARVEIFPAALDRVERNAAVVRSIVENYEKDPEPVTDYGVTTGFGQFKHIAISPQSMRDLQINILESHCVGVGENLDPNDLSNYYPAEVIRAVIALRLNTFLAGHSGVRPWLAEVLCGMLHRRVIPLVPLRGSVGSSGDLAPLAHLFVWLTENGRKSARFYQWPAEGQPIRIEDNSQALPALLGLNLSKCPLEPKEGLALTNGATFSAALLALAVHDASSLSDTADTAAGLAAEAMLGCARAFDDKIHQARRQRGQIESASRLRALLTGSKLLERAEEVQDPYSIRCAPAVHGASRDTIRFVRDIVEREINCAADNPLFFNEDEEKAWDCNFTASWPWRREKRFEPRHKPSPDYDGSRRRSYSACNFHGQPLALAADFLAIALAELANISERRTQLLMDKNHNRGLPANLIPNAGVNSGFMLAQYCAASLVSENKVLTHPASVDSIPTSSGTEDHNSMAPIAGRKLRTVLANTRHALAIELMIAAQAVEWATLFEKLIEDESNGILSPDGKEYLRFLREWNSEKQRLNARRQLESIENQGRIERSLFEEWTRPANRNSIAGQLGQGTAPAYLAIRESIEPMIEDRILEHDIRRVAQLLDPGTDRIAALQSRLESIAR